MSAQIIPFPTRKRETFDCVGAEWMYVVMRSYGEDETDAREWAARLGPTIRSTPEDVAVMRARIAELARG